MIKNFLFILLIFICTPSYTYELDGIWQEDVDKTIQWNKTNRIVEEEYLKKMGAIMGHMWISYSEGDWCLFNEPYEHNYSGKKTAVPRFDTSFGKYKILAENEYGYVIESSFKNDHKNIEMIVFESDDSLYAHGLTTEDFGQPGSRVYFKRVAPVKWSFDCE